MSRCLLMIACLAWCSCEGLCGLPGQDTKVVLRGGERGTALEQALTGSVSQANLLASARKLVGFGARQAGSEPAAKAVALLAGELAACGLKARKSASRRRPENRVKAPESRKDNSLPYSVLATLPGSKRGGTILVNAILAGREGALDAAGSAAPAAVLLEVARVLGTSRRAHARSPKTSQELPPLAHDVTFAFWADEDRSFIAWAGDHPKELASVAQVLVAGPMGRDDKPGHLYVAGPEKNLAIRVMQEYQGASGFWRNSVRVTASARELAWAKRYSVPHFLLHRKPWIFYSTSPRLGHLDQTKLDAAALQRGARAMLLGILRLGR